MPISISAVSYPDAPDDYSMVRITFSEPAVDDAPWTLSKFRLIPLGTGVEPIISAAASVAAAGGGIDAIDVTASRMTAGITYKAWIEGGYVRRYANPSDTLDPPNNEKTFTAQTEPFQVEQLEALAPAILRVTFNEKPQVLDELVNPARYTISGGLQVLGVTVSGDRSVDLVTTVQTPGTSYQLSVQVTP